MKVKERDRLRMGTEKAGTDKKAGTDQEAETDERQEPNNKQLYEQER